MGLGEQRKLCGSFFFRMVPSWKHWEGQESECLSFNSFCISLFLFFTSGWILLILYCEMAFGAPHTGQTASQHPWMDPVWLLFFPSKCLENETRSNRSKVTLPSPIVSDAVLPFESSRQLFTRRLVSCQYVTACDVIILTSPHLSLISLPPSCKMEKDKENKTK